MSKKEGDNSVSPTVAAMIISAVLLTVAAYAKTHLSPPSSPAYDAKAFAAEDKAPGQAFDDWYPADITPPGGKQYPCALTPLPHDLDGVPPSHRRFINHAYSLILRATQAKLLVYDELGSADPSADALDHYLSTMREAEGRLKDEPTPSSLEPFRDDILAAFELQMTFFTKAFDQRRGGQDFQQLLAIPEGHAASKKLNDAWNRMAARYPGLSPEMKDSLNHHLCALDLF